MSYRAESEKAGFCQIMFRSSDWCRIALNEFEPLTEALKRGEEWYEAVNLHGGTEWVRLSAVMHVAECTAAQVVAFDAEETDRVSYKRTHGGDDES